LLLPGNGVGDDEGREVGVAVGVGIGVGDAMGAPTIVNIPVAPGGLNWRVATLSEKLMLTGCT
jgi:hypothetical protein